MLQFEAVRMQEACELHQNIRILHVAARTWVVDDRLEKGILARIVGSEVPANLQKRRDQRELFANLMKLSMFDLISPECTIERRHLMYLRDCFPVLLGVPPVRVS